MLWNDTYRIALFGHRDFEGYRTVETRLPDILKDFLRTKAFVEIYVGRNGEFDIYAASVVKRVQNAVGKDNSELICVLPYSEKDLEYYEAYYDSVLIPECCHTHPKAAIAKRNRWMVEQADLLICYIDHESGGAYAAVKYAQEQGKAVINLVLDE